MQLRLVSVFYNVSLCAFYYMTIVLGWRETALKSKVKYLHAFPLVLGLVLCFAAIPYYGSVLMYCHIPVPPLSASLVPKRWLFDVPAFLALATCPINMFLVWLKVHGQAGAASRWTFASSARSAAFTEESDGSPFFSKLWSSSRWVSSPSRVPSTTLEQAERSVIWQGFYYTFAFCFVWIATVVIERMGANGKSVPYGAYCLLYFMLPLQPFLNWLT
jgi:hypothetical protein